MFYVFDGEDTFTIREALSALVDKMGDPATRELNITHLDGLSTTFHELHNHCNTLPFFASRRLVIVHGLLARLGQRGRSSQDAEFLEKLVDDLPNLPETTRLVFVEEKAISRKHPVLALAAHDEQGHIKTFRIPQGAALSRWIRQHVQQAGGQIDAPATQTLGAFVGNDLHQLDQEIQKLVAYTDGQRPIGERDVVLLTPQAHQASIFDMVDSMGRRDGKTASHIYHQLLDAGEHPLALLGMITRQFRLMIQVKELAPQLGTADAIAREIHQNPYPIKKIMSQSENYTMSQLHAIYHKLLDTDVDIKTGRIEPALALDMLIAGLSRVA
jgi:DNA polymerase-3 subunit delta